MVKESWRLPVETLLGAFLVLATHPSFGVGAAFACEPRIESGLQEGNAGYVAEGAIVGRAQEKKLMGKSASEECRETVVLDNGRVRATFEIGPKAVSESYYVVNRGKPRLMARNVSLGGLGATFLAADTDNGDRSHVAADYSAVGKQVVEGKMKIADIAPFPEPGPLAPVCPIRYKSHSFRGRAGAPQTLTIAGETEAGDKIERTISLGPADDFLHVRVTMVSHRRLSLEYLDDGYNFSPKGAPDFTWMPQLKMIEENLCPDWTFKSPAAIVQKKDLVFALVPDLNDLKSSDTLKRCNVALDMDVRTSPGPAVTYGLVPTVHHHHCLFRHVPGQRCIVEPGAIRYSYYILLKAQVPDREAHRDVAGFLWERFGHKGLLEGHAAQQFTFKQWGEKTWHEFADKVWMDVERDGIPCGSLQCDCPVLQVKNDGWFCAWWNNLRTAYGLELYSRRSGDKVAHERARKILNLALDAPRKDGAFPIVFHIEDDGPHWDRDHKAGGYVECYHNFDMAWTSYWLLKWHNDLKANDDRILPYCVAYGDFVLKHQQLSGFIPTYFNEDFTVREGTRLNVESAEPAACAVFLVELYMTVGELKYLGAAMKAMDYVQREIVPEHKWFDYETFLSCSPKPYDYYDSITAQHPRCTMGMIVAAQAFLALHDVTREQRFLERGMNVLDYLSLSQQVWSHPAMTPNLIGGFNSQNSDADWSDARQAYCAIVYLDYFDRCGKVEYLERGIAALRASFAVAPYENWAHMGFIDAPGVLSGFHWGQGSAMASVEMVWDKYGDVLVDLVGKWAYGINGCTVGELIVDEKKVALQIKTDLKWGEPARIVFRNVPDGDYDVIINGKKAGRFSSAALLQGFQFSLGT